MRVRLRVPPSSAASRAQEATTTHPCGFSEQLGLHPVPPDPLDLGLAELLVAHPFGELEPGDLPTFGLLSHALPEVLVGDLRAVSDQLRQNGYASGRT